MYIYPALNKHTFEWYSVCFANNDKIIRNIRLEYLKDPQVAI